MKYYNENEYFFKEDKEALKIIDDKRVEKQNEYAEEKEKFLIIRSLYDKLISNVSKQLNEFDIQNASISKSLLLYYLTMKGCFSIDDGFKYETKLPFYFETFEGLNVVEGHGCCSNLSSFHKDVFDKLDEYSKRYYAYENRNFGFKTLAFNRVANHVINLIKYNDNLYGFDMVDGKLYYLFNEWQMKACSYNYTDYLTYKPYWEMMHDDKSLEDVKNNLEMFKSYLKKSRLLADDFIDMDKNIKDLINDSSKKIESIKEENLELKLKIKELIC